MVKINELRLPDCKHSETRALSQSQYSKINQITAKIDRRDRKIAELLWEAETFCQVTPPFATHPVYDSIMQTLPHNVDAGKVVLAPRKSPAPRNKF